MLIGIVSSFGYFGCFWPSLSWIISRIGVLCLYCLFLRVLHTHTHQSTHCELLLHGERVGAQNSFVKGTLPGHCFICFFLQFHLISTGAKGTQTILQQ